MTGREVTCRVCHGDGDVLVNPGYPDPQEAFYERCEHCRGTGRVWSRVDPPSAIPPLEDAA